MVESLGDYFAAADISGAPVPPPGVISRAVALQGATCALAGVWGTTSGTTAYNEVSKVMRQDGHNELHSTLKRDVFRSRP
jgi:xanthine/uracil permease